MAPRPERVSPRYLCFVRDNDFVFFAQRGELASNRTEDQELSMLALHLLQNCMVYINTLMMQQVLARPHWARLLTPTASAHVRPYRSHLKRDAVEQLTGAHHAG